VKKLSKKVDDCCSETIELDKSDCDCSEKEEMEIEEKGCCE
jgi:hypothetical protein